MPDVHGSPFGGSLQTASASLSGSASVRVSASAAISAESATLTAHAWRNPLTINLIHRAEAHETVRATLIHRATSYQSIPIRRIFRGSTGGENNPGVCSIRFLHRSDSSLYFPKVLVHRGRLFPELVPNSGMPATPPPGHYYGPGQPELPPKISKFEQAWRFGYVADGDYSTSISIVGPDVAGGSKNLGCVPSQINLSLNESNPSTWGLAIQDGDKYHPMNKTSSWYGVMDEEPLKAGGGSHVIRKEMQAKILLADTSHIFHGLGTAWSHELDSKSQSIAFSWKGVDHSQKLFCDGQTMPDVRSNSRGVVYSHTVLKEILTKYDVQFDLSHLPDNFPIPFLSRQNGRPIDWIMQILSVSLAEWTMIDGLIFTPYLPEISASPAFTYFLEGPGVIDSESYSASMQNAYNMVSISRSADVGGNAVTVECKDFGQYTASFHTPVNMPRWSIETQQGGVCSDYAVYNAGGSLIGYRESRLASFTPLGGAPFVDGVLQNVAKIVFTFGHLPVNPGDGVTDGYAKVVFTGTPAVNVGAFGGAQFDGETSSADPLPAFKAMAVDSASIGKYGLRAIEIPPNPLLPTKEAAQIHAARYLYRLSRQVREATYKVPFNPALYPGTVVAEVHRAFGITKLLPRKRLITKVSHNLSNRPDQRYTTYTGNEYPDPSGITVSGSDGGPILTGGGIKPGIGSLIR